MSKIIPQKKVMPKFFNDEVPPPLLNRFKSPDNSHHPIIISNSEKIDFMFKTIAENRIDDFNSIFSSINNPNIKNSFGDTLLTFAVLMKRHDAISSLLSKGANPNLANDLGYTPLNIAIEMVDYKSTSILIEIGGAKVDFIDDLGRTYLMQAARVGSLPIVDLLISKGVDINAADNNGTTALAIAYKHKKDIIAKYLLKFGAKSWIKKNYIEDDTPMIQDLFNKWK
jgi:ankyrin repeat protein